MLDDDLNGAPSSFSQLFKNSGRTQASLAEKRALFLRQQKEKSGAAFDEMRDLSEFFEQDEDHNNSSRRIKKPPIKFKLMSAEWLTDVPEDLSENWLVKLCPVGLRYLIVAYKGITSCYLKKNKPSFRFRSRLPGGGSDTPANKFTVLDCIYCKTSETYLVYDVLAWNSMSLLNAEAQTRFFWLKSKFQEEPDMFHLDCKKVKGFELLDCFPAEPALLQDCLSTAVVVNEHSFACDSVLFYHKEGHYVFGRSPLVGWLKSFMLQQVLGIDVAELHLANTPSDYAGITEFLREKSRKKDRVHDVEMEHV